jgi:hypothetical protein
MTICGDTASNRYLPSKPPTRTGGLSRPVSPGNVTLLKPAWFTDTLPLVVARGDPLRRVVLGGFHKLTVESTDDGFEIVSLLEPNEALPCDEWKITFVGSKRLYLIVPERASAARVAYFLEWVNNGCATQQYSGFYSALYGQRCLDPRIIAWWSPGGAAMWTFDRVIAGRLLDGVQRRR